MTYLLLLRAKTSSWHSPWFCLRAEYTCEGVKNRTKDARPEGRGKVSKTGTQETEKIHLFSPLKNNGQVLTTLKTRPSHTTEPDTTNYIIPLNILGFLFMLFVVPN